MRRRVGLASDKLRDSDASGWVAAQEGGELSEIDTVLAVVVVEVAAGPTDSVVAGRGLAYGGTRRWVTGMAGYGCVRSRVRRCQWAFRQVHVKYTSSTRQVNMIYLTY